MKSFGSGETLRAAKVREERGGGGAKTLSPREQKLPVTQAIQVTVLCQDNFTVINCNVPLIPDKEHGKRL